MIIVSVWTEHIDTEVKTGDFLFQSAMPVRIVIWERETMITVGVRSLT